MKLQQDYSSSLQLEHKVPFISLTLCCHISFFMSFYFPFLLTNLRRIKLRDVYKVSATVFQKVIMNNFPQYVPVICFLDASWKLFIFKCLREEKTKEKLNERRAFIQRSISLPWRQKRINYFKINHCFLQAAHELKQPLPQYTSAYCNLLQ